MIDKYELGGARGKAAYEDVARVGIAMYEAKEEHLSGEKVDHGGHYGGEGESETAGLRTTFPRGAVGFEEVCRRRGGRL